METTEAIITPALAQGHAGRSGNRAPGEPESSRRPELAAVLFAVVALLLPGVPLLPRSPQPRPQAAWLCPLPASVLTGALNVSGQPCWLGEPWRPRPRIYCLCVHTQASGSLPGPGPVGRQQLGELLGGSCPLWRQALARSPVALSVPVFQCTEVLPALPSLCLAVGSLCLGPLLLLLLPPAHPVGFSRDVTASMISIWARCFSLCSLQHPGFPSAQFSIATDGSLVPTCVSGEVPGTQ